MKKIIAVLLALSTVIAESGVYAATYVNGEDVTNEVFTTISNDYTLFPVRYLGEISITEVRRCMTGTETAITL